MFSLVSGVAARLHVITLLAGGGSALPGVLLWAACRWGYFPGQCPGRSIQHIHTAYFPGEGVTCLSRLGSVAEALAGP